MTTLRDRRQFDTDIYAPAEDSHLLAETCVETISRDERVLDVGTGTGVVAAHIRESTDARVVGVDVNPIACRRARDHDIPVVRGHLTTAFGADTFDVVVCNPPYLPTEPEHPFDDWLAVAIAGGPDGRRIVNALLADVGRVLRPDGRLYLLVSSLMDVDAVEERAVAAGFDSTELSRDASFPFEVLSVLALARMD